jgi:omega-hydroxy-beta-dihydromenaquinone-9 sulfotransferase
LKNSYLTAGISLPSFLRLLRRNRISYHPTYLFRIFIIFQSSVWTSVFKIFEDLFYRKKILATPVPDDPIFIIGHWRTGSTFLHHLLNLDDSLCAPTLFQVAIPDAFLCSYRYYLPLMNAVVEKVRPMDSVRIGVNEPQEDEYAIFRMTGISPLERLVFPAGDGYFLLGHDGFLPEDPQLPAWEDKVTWFFRKLKFRSGRTIVSKNPFNSFRIPELKKVFPKARFIHIYRHPFDVVPSTIHMWNIVQRQNCLNHLSRTPDVSEVVRVIRRVHTAIRQSALTLPPGTFHEIRFESLEADPVGELKKIYAAFGMEFTSQVEERIHDCLDGLKGYRKNSYSVSDVEKELIRAELKDYMEQYGYV